MSLSHLDRSGIRTDIDNRLDALAATFASAQPFGHVVIDDFLEPDFAHALRSEFPDFARGNAIGENGQAGPKSTVERIRKLGPAFSRLDNLIKSREFLDTLGTICNIQTLLYDPWYLGGGTHDNRDGAQLDAHVDFNFHPIERWRRRINLIVYMSDIWQADWGGALDLYADPRVNPSPAQSVVPAFNRCVIFETHDHSWHGFQRIQLPIEQQALSRKSIALYFYTDDQQHTQHDSTAFSTIYIADPLPDHLQAGHTLTAQDVDTLHRLMAARDGRIQQQYQEISRLMTLIRAHESGVSGKLMFLARRTWARLRELRN